MKDQIAALDFTMQAADGECSLEIVTLENFLISVERRAFLIARSKLGNDQDALDTVQDAMTKLVQRYAHKDADQLRPLFYSILDRKITDVYRRRAVRDRFKGWLSVWSDDDSEAESPDPFQHVAGAETDDPAVHLERLQKTEELLTAMAELPQRQQQAFMFRCWEGLSTAETAATMKCSEGSVKTHYSRALQALRDKLEAWQ